MKRAIFLALFTVWITLAQTAEPLPKFDAVDAHTTATSNTQIPSPVQAR